MVSSTNLEKPPPPKRYIKFLGLVCVFFSAFFAALGDALVQYILRNNEGVQISEFQILFVQSAVQMLLIGPIVAWKRMDPFGGSKRNFVFLTLMGFAKLGVNISFYASVEILPLGDATVIALTAPVFTVFLGIAILKEKVSFCNVFLGLVSFLGVAIIAAPGVFFPNQPTKPNSFAASHSLAHKNITYTHFLNSIEESVKGVSYAALAALSLSFNIVILKYISTGVDYRINLLYPGFYGMIISPIAMGILNNPVILGQLGTKYWLLMVLTGFLYFFALWFLSVSLTLEDAGPVALIRTSEVLFAFAFEILIENQRPMMFTGVGVLLILLGTVTIMINRLFDVEQRLYRRFKKSSQNDSTPYDDDEVGKPILEQYTLVPSEFEGVDEKLEKEK